MSLQASPQILQLAARGLFTNPNVLSQAPLGALSIANNLVIDREGLMQSRRGFKQYGNAFPTEGSIFTLYQIFPYKGTQVVWYGGQATQSNHLLAYDSKDYATGDITVVNYSPLHLTKASGTVTVVDYTVLSGAVLTINGTPLTEGVDWTAAFSNNSTADSLSFAINNLPDVDAANPPANAITVIAATAGTAGNSITLATSDAVNLTISGGTLTGGQNAAILAIGDVVLTESTDFTAATSNEATAQSILTAILINVTNVSASVDNTVISLIANAIGSTGNSIVLTSSNGANLSVSGAGTLTGGIDEGTWVELSGTLPPAQQTTDTYHFTEASRNLYFSTLEGVKKLDVPSGPIKNAGGLPGLDGQISTTGVSGWMEVNSQVAYRMTWQFTDDNGNIIVGTPSQRDVIHNGESFTIISVPDGTHLEVGTTTGMTAGDTVLEGIAETSIVTVVDGTHIEVVDSTGFAAGDGIYGHTVNTTLIYTIPDGVTTSMVYKIFRSEMSASVSTQPSESLQLVIQDSPDSTDISNGYFTVTDATPDSLRGELIYTAPGAQGILQQNNIPPSCSDMVFYKGFVFYSDTTIQNIFDLTLLATDAPDGVQVDDTLTITRGSDTFTITGKSSENIAAGQFLVETSLTPAENVNNTAQSIVRVINRYSSNSFIYAYYLSGEVNTPGQILLQERAIGGENFKVTSSRSTCWGPVLPSVNGPSSTAEHRQDRVFYSKFQQPEAVPLLNYLDVGSANSPILRILALRDSIVIFKEDGTFRLTGESAPFSITRLDTTIILRAPETAVNLYNQVFAYTNQGVVMVSETGSEIISRPIENQLQTLSSVVFSQFNSASFGTSYENDRKYILWTIDVSEPTKVATVAYVYNIITESWTKWIPPVDIWDAVVDPADGKLYLASGDQDSPYVYQERKQFLFWDYADQQFSKTLIGNSGTIVELDSTSNLAVDDKLVQLDTTTNPFTMIRFSNISSIVDATHVEVEDDLPWDPDDTTVVYRPILVELQLLPVHAGSAGIVKTFKEFQALFQEIDAESINISFATDFSPGASETSLKPIGNGGWGDFPWGDVPWGDNTQLAQCLRTYIPLQARKGHWMNISIRHNDALTHFLLGGIHLILEPTTTRYFGGNRF